jgi:hypothetical protein
MKGRNVLYVSIVLSLTLAVVGIAIAAEGEKANLKVGDTYYICGCPPGCCEVISSKEGECNCKKPLVKATVTKVGDGTATFKVEGQEKEKVMKTAGLYICDCPPACKCNTISDKPGTCGCGKEMKKIGG